MIPDEKTWRDIENRALVDPVLHAAVTLVRRGELTREQALIAAALALSEVREGQQAELVDHISRCTCGAERSK